MNNRFDLNFLKKLFPDGEEVRYAKGDIICRTHQKVVRFMWLIQGELKYTVTVDEELETELLTTSTPFVPIGWSSLNEAGRFYYDIYANSESTVFTVPTESVLNLEENDFFLSLLRNTGCQLYKQLNASLNNQVKALDLKVTSKSNYVEDHFISQEGTEKEIIDLLHRSPFFGHFPENEISQLLPLLDRRDYRPAESVIEQGKDSEGLFILMHGDVSIQHTNTDSYVRLRSISTPGFLFGWSCLLGSPDICSAISRQQSTVYFISKTSLIELFTKNVSFGCVFLKRLIWLIGNQLNLSFSRYIELLTDQELIATKYLIESNKPKLSLNSDLHRISHLLANPSTKPMAFDILHRLNKEGSNTERHIASVSLDLLKQEEKEVGFIKGLHKVYESVTEDDSLTTPEEKRTACVKASRDLFDQVDFHLEGEEHLPVTAGNIFIYNHLMNHPKYTLNNNFQITLDSHFISMLLYKKYNDPGIRTIRVGKGAEFAHQNYYEQLGYINVFTKDSDAQTKETLWDSRNYFFNEAGRYLKEGYNIIISPEGTSYSTQESPGPFKQGAFQLATLVNPEPMIIPIVIANFDRFISDHVLFCRILEPFKISEKMKKGEALKEFVDQYQNSFSEEVERARNDSNEILNQRLVS